MKSRVRVTRALFAPQIDRLKAHFEVIDNQVDAPVSAAQLVDMLAGVDAVVLTGGERIDEAALARADRLKLVASVSVGYNHVDLAALARRGIILTNTPDVLTESTADFGFALMMAAARRINESERWMRAGHWQRWTLGQMCGQDIHGSTLGILGMGRIGQSIARRARGFNMSIVYHNRHPLAADVERELGATWLSFDALFQRADHLMLVLPYTPESHHIVDARALALMKPSATLTNIARGGIVDEAALAAALREGRIAAAGLDVFEGEPKVRDELLALDHVALTPHIASATMATRAAMADLAIDNVIAVLEGRAPLTPVALPVL